MELPPLVVICTYYFVTVLLIPWCLPATEMNVTARYHCVFTLALLIQRMHTKKRKVKNLLDSCLCQKQGGGNDKPKGPVLEAENSRILGYQSLFHEISRKINDVLVQRLCQTTVSQFHNLTDTREVSFCHCFSYMLKSKSSVGLQQRKKVHPREWHYFLQCRI